MTLLASEAMGPDGTGYYDGAYARSSDELYAAIRREAFGEDIGQFSWLTADEYATFADALAIDAGSHVLEVACGTGGPALFLADRTGCRVTGVDLHEAGIAAANSRADELGLADRASFVHADTRSQLPFGEATFDALVCIDAWNHFDDRESVLSEWFRVLRAGAGLLFTDPIVVTGMLRRDEMATRSDSMGEFVFTPPGVDEQLVRDAGFVDVRAEDATANMWEVPRRWRDAREQHRSELEGVEGQEGFVAFQHFLEVVETLARERRLSRIAVLARRP
jgi:cyclopropane fatty-acyl-phospholipid synthase-like methyltransferase